MMQMCSPLTNHDILLNLVKCLIPSPFVCSLATDNLIQCLCEKSLDGIAHEQTIICRQLFAGVLMSKLARGFYTRLKHRTISLGVGRRGKGIALLFGCTCNVDGPLDSRV